MEQYKYTLKVYKGQDKKHTCPSCGVERKFSRYIDTENGEYIADDVGKCNRLDKCAYHKTPKQYFSENQLLPDNTKLIKTKPKQQILPTSYIDKELMDKTILYDTYIPNNFVAYLEKLFDNNTVDWLINTYKIGTSKLFGGGSTIFWQIDSFGNVRTGKIMKYDKTGHRIKNNNNWVHIVSGQKDFNLKQCLFGEHILKYVPENKVGIVESEKTAIIMQVLIPNIVWLASGGADGLNHEKVIALRGRKVILFPDASKDGTIYNKWYDKAKLFGFEISNYLENNTSQQQKNQGVDLADFLSIE